MAGLLGAFIKHAGARKGTLAFAWNRVLLGSLLLIVARIYKSK